jgi:hypothetical protein
MPMPRGSRSIRRHSANGAACEWRASRSLLQPPGEALSLAAANGVTPRSCRQTHRSPGSSARQCCRISRKGDRSWSTTGSWTLSAIVPAGRVNTCSMVVPRAQMSSAASPADADSLETSTVSPTARMFEASDCHAPGRGCAGLSRPLRLEGFQHRRTGPSAELRTTTSLPSPTRKYTKVICVESHTDYGSPSRRKMPSRDPIRRSNILASRLYGLPASPAGAVPGTWSPPAELEAGAP